MKPTIFRGRLKRLLIVSGLLVIVTAISIIAWNSQLKSFPPLPSTTQPPTQESPPNSKEESETSPSPQAYGSWKWETLGCGSQAPCSYRVFSKFYPNEYYYCQGKLLNTTSETTDEEIVNENETTPTSNTDPRTTSDFTCQKAD